MLEMVQQQLGNMVPDGLNPITNVCEVSNAVHEFRKNGVEHSKKLAVI
jgi:hypothetical protein